MSMLGDSWCTIEEESKFCLSKDLVRSEEQDGKVIRVNIDDLELKIEGNLG